MISMVITTIEITMIARIRRRSSDNNYMHRFENTHVVLFKTTKQMFTHLALFEMVHTYIST